MLTLLINILLVILSTILAVLSIGGETWDSARASVLERITPRGWASVGVLMTITCLGIAKEILQDREQRDLESTISELRLANDQVLSEREFKLVNVGLDINFLAEKLGVPQARFKVDGLECDGAELTYSRWSDIGRNSIQTISNSEGKVSGFVLYSNRMELNYRGEKVDPYKVPTYEADGPEYKLMYGDARFGGYAQGKHGASFHDGNDIWEGWERLQGKSAEFYEALNSDPIDDYALWMLNTQLSEPKLGVFAPLEPQVPCHGLNHMTGEESRGTALDTVFQARAQFVSLSFEAFEWIHD